MKGDFILTTTKKRGNGEGSWKKLGTNKWKVTISVGVDANGKQVRKTKTGTKQECMKWFKSNQEISNNDYFYDYAMKWLEFKKNSLAPSTYRNTRTRIKLISDINNFQMNKCSDNTIMLIVNELVATKSKATIVVTISVLNQVLRFARDRGVINFIPYIPKIRTSPIKKKIDIPSIKKIKEVLLLAKFIGGHLYLCILLGFLAGLRIGEILALQKGDIDFEQSTITINKTLTMDENYKTYIKEGTKTNNSNRTIYVNNRILSEVKLYFDDKKFKKNRYLPHESKKVSMFFKQAGFENFTAHSTRHVFITLAQEYGISPVFVSQYVGHKTNSTTISVYTHMTIDKQNQKLDEFVYQFLD